jgi:signal transduction histidine kinase
MSIWHSDDRPHRTIVLGWMTIPVAVALGVAFQRHAFTDPVPRDLLIVALLVPCAADSASRWVAPLGRIPRLVWTLLAGVCVLGLLLEPVKNDVAPFFLLIYTAEAAGEGPTWRGVTALVLYSGIILGLDLSGRFAGSWSWLLGIWLVFVTALAFRSVVDLVHALKDAQDDLAARAAADERQRIAREVHDVVAHSLAVTMLHVTGARMAIKRDPAEAVEALEQAEELGRQSLAEVRRIVGLLQPDGAGTAPPQPGATDVPALVDEFRDAGLRVLLTVDGDLASVAPSSGLALYRITQESLTNVTKHAPGAAADVCVAVTNGSVTVTVTNDASPRSVAPNDSGAGLGLPGMYDRATSLGGALRAGVANGSNGSGAWQVEAELPTTPA